MANFKKTSKQEIPLAPKTTNPIDSKEQPNSKKMAIISGITKEINKTRGEKIAFNLKTDDDAPTNVKNWFSTTAIKLDYIISNKRNGGIPEGRIIEIFGEPSSGKSTLAQTICAQAQKNGAIAVYIDSENATSVENLSMLGVNTDELIFVQEQCVEDTFQLIEQIITSVKNQDNDMPVIIVWDSIAASVSRAELEATYEQQQIGIKARALSKGIMKVNQILKDKRVTLLLVNQTRQKIGILHGDACVSPETKVKIRTKLSSKC
jgi:recombination protein RecA